MPHAFRRTVLLLLLLLNMVDTEEPGFVFKHQGGDFQTGVCYAADNMVVFKSSGTGDQLLVNSSAGAVASFFAEDLQGRANITYNDYMDYGYGYKDYGYMDLLVGHLNPRDEGLYRTECWLNGTLVKHRRQQLVVCSEEVESEKMTLLEDDWAEVRCKGSVGALAGATVHWYYNPDTFSEDNVLLDPLLAGLQGAVEVRDGGTLLRVSNSALLNLTTQFHCVVMKGQNCLSFQKINLPRYVHRRTIHASLGDRVVLACSSEYKSQIWKTPLGRINTTTKSPESSEGSTQGGPMYISRDNELKSHSLIIPAVSGDHMGQYSCFSPSLERVYLISFCPGVDSREKSAMEGGDILLECDLHQNVPGDLIMYPQWYRGSGAEEDIPIWNTMDQAEGPPGNPGRGVIMSEDGFSLKLLGLTVEDAGVYRCIVFGRKPILQSENDYRDSDDEEEEEEHPDQGDYGSFSSYDGYDGNNNNSDFNYSDYSWPTAECISRQEIVLTVALTPTKVKGRGLDLATNDLANDLESGVSGSAVGAAVVAGLLLVGVIATVAVMKIRSKGCFKQEHAPANAGPNFHQDTEMARDPGCTEMLAPNDAYNAC